MPLTMADIGQEYVITLVKGNDAAKLHLQSLGFTLGARVVVVSDVSGGLIVNIREARIAINRQMANKVMVA